MSVRSFHGLNAELRKRFGCTCEFVHDQAPPRAPETIGRHWDGIGFAGLHRLHLHETPPHDVTKSQNFLRFPAISAGTKQIEMDLTPMVQIEILEKPIQRIRETCAMMGIAETFDRALPDLETFLEAEVARGEVSESRLTFDGLRYLKQRLAKQ